MKFSATVLALAAGASAAYYPVPSNGTSYVTEVVESYVTYCSEPTTITYGTKTYPVTKPTTLTITDCPCTISKPVYTTSYSECKTCSSKPTSYPSVYQNTTIASTSTVVPTSIKPTGGYPTSATSAPSTVPTAGADKMVALSGAGLLGVMGFVAAML